jgi:succinate-semialdehyde dehydrogenase / glutarate-semialdehyde dehydrogenase
MSYQSVNPYTAKTEQLFPEITDAQLEHKLAMAHSGYLTWRALKPSERSTIVHKAALLLRERMDEFATPMTLEMGKLFEESRGEVKLSADILDYYAKHAESFLAPVKLSPEQGSAAIESSPIGVLFGVQPWNFPYYQLARFAAPNLMAGNVVMVKHAGCVPQCALAFEQLFIDAGAPPGVYTNLFISYQQVENVVSDTRIQGVALTGSVAAGKKIAQLAGKHMKKTTMELGGSDAFIVLEDADLPQALKWAVWAKMNNMGQCCIAAKRFIILDSIYDEFLEGFKSAMIALKPGDPMHADTTLGPLSTEAALKNLLQQVDAAIKSGASLLLGGGRIVDQPGAFMHPTILSDVNPENPAYRDEFFGPVAIFFRVKNETAAIALANDSDFGLGCSIFTSDLARAQSIAQQIEAGMVFINHPTWTAPDLPFGGIKYSGYGRELSSLGIHEFVNKKLIRVSALDDAA